MNKGCGKEFEDNNYGNVYCGEKLSDGEVLLCKECNASTNSALNSPLSNTHATGSEKVVPSQDKIEDTHSQNKKEIDKDYVDISKGYIECPKCKINYAICNCGGFVKDKLNESAGREKQ